ncbi:hypothetical protein ID866_9270 [Astraeus odoratus]|nr:hypothetical protein ID866_9270 [Astraeus odoratus]
MLSPVLEKLTRDPELRTGTGRSVDLVTINTDKQTELARHYSISSLPTVVAFREGKPIGQFMGALNEAGVKQFLQRL